MFSLPMQGQFLKKLQEKVGHQFQSEAKSMVSLGSKGAVSLDILMDQNLDVFEFQRALEMADPMEISELYDFEWKYTFDIKTKNGEGRMHVLFKRMPPILPFKFLNLLMTTWWWIPKEI